MPKKNLKLSLLWSLQRSVSPVFSLCLILASILSNSTRAEEVFLENASPLHRGSDVGFLLDTPTREKIDLSGMWSYAVEGGGTGHTRLPAAGDFIGTTTFARTFDISDEQAANYSYHLVMYGVNYQSQAFVNGSLVASHSGGYTSFMQELPENSIQPGPENRIEIVAGNELDDRDTVPLRLQVWGWRNYGGILRDVYLLATPKLFLNDVTVQSTLTEDLSRSQLNITADIAGTYDLTPVNPRRKVTLGIQAELIDRITGETVGTSKVVPVRESDDGWVANQIAMGVVRPKLWSPDHPDLYLVKVILVRREGKETSVIDEMHFNHGFRQIAINDADFYLNGENFRLRGVIWNEDHPSWGSSLPYDQMEKDIVLMKNLGANAVRFGSHPPHPYMLNLCDRYGLFALVELPVAYSPASILNNDYYTELAGNMMKEMIMRDRSHPSVFAWGLGEGFESSDREARPFIESLISTARSLDDRPLYYASVMHSADVCSDLVDIAAINLYTRDPSAFRERLEQWKTLNPLKPVIVAKFGTEVQHENRNGYSDPLSNEAQARFFLQRFDDIRSMKYDGAFVWAMNDWRADRPALTVSSGDPRMHTMGLVSYRREKRLAFDAVRSLFRGEKFVALPAGNYSSTAPIIYVVSGLILLIGTAYLYNADRRFRESVNRSLMNSYNFFSDIRDQRLVSLFHSTILGMITSSAMAIVASTALYHSRGSWVLDAALSYLVSSDNVKEFIIGLILNPLELIVYLAVAFFLILLAVSTAVFILARALKSRLFAYHAFSLTMWATVPFLILIPVGMILFRLLESGEYVIPSFVLVLALIIWVNARVLKGVSIIADIFRPKVYALSLTSIVGLLAVGYFVLDYSQSASEYLMFLYNVASNAY